MKNKQTTNIEFYAGPNAGKTTASTLFSSLLAVNGYVVEIPPKIPQQFLLNNEKIPFNDPFKMYFKQLEGIKFLQEQTDYAVLDNPLLLELLYLKDKNITIKEMNILKELIILQRNGFNNIPIYLHKEKSIIKENSYFNKEETEKKNFELKKLLKDDLKINFAGEYHSHPLVGLEILYDFYKKGIIKLNNKLVLDFLKETENIVEKIKLTPELKETVYLKENNKIINLYAGPGSGKSTTSRTLSSLLGGNGISSIAPIEIPKLYIWKKSYQDLTDQLKVFANQKYYQDLCNKKFKVSVVDSPLLMQLVYMNEDENNNVNFLKELIINSFKEKEKNSISYFLKRQHKYSNYGRIHNEIQSGELNNKIIETLMENSVNFKSFSTHPFIGFEIFNNLIEKEKLIQINEPLITEFLEITKKYIKESKIEIIKEQKKERNILNKELKDIII